MTEDRPIVRYVGGREEARLDLVVVEARVRIVLDGRETAAMMALPHELEELAVGFLFAECVFDHPSEIAEVQSNERLHSVSVRLLPGERREAREAVRTFTTGCGRSVSRVSPLWADRFGRVAAQGSHPVSELLQAIRTLAQGSALFRRTGGVHSAGLWTGQGFAWICDDVGRHNAVDKVIGHALRERWPLPPEAVLVTTGRLSSDIVLKAIRARVPIVVSRSAPTSTAVQLAEEHGVTVVGFARGDRCNVYAHADRIRPS